jgi:hypothetical protein
MIQENVKVIVVDNALASEILKVLFLHAEKVLVLGCPPTFVGLDIVNYYPNPEPINIQLKKPKAHGAYRQFLKRDKRKNFKLK